MLSTADGFEFERIAALEPDLIVGTNAGLTEKDYELLSQIAPTIPSVEGSTRYFSSWQDQTLQIARALGREDDGQALIDEVEAKYAAVAAAHPEWDGHDRDVLAGRALRRPALRLPGRAEHRLPHRPRLHDDHRASRTTRPTTAPRRRSPAENVGLIDADVVVFATENEEQFDELQEFGTIVDLPAVAENRSVYTDEILAGAIYFDTPLSLEYTSTGSRRCWTWPLGARRRASSPHDPAPDDPTPEESTPMSPSRRSFLAGLSALAVAPVLVACGRRAAASRPTRRPSGEAARRVRSR